MATTNIEWTEVTWNPLTGCTKVSDGCANCYAKLMAKRMQRAGNARYANGFDLTLHWDLIEQPKSWRKPRVVFVNSMSDLFHESVPLEFIQAVFKTMVECPQHTFQVLTKRAWRLAELAGELPWPENVWMGTSVENMKVVDRIDHLRTVPAAVRFISAEPLLGPLEVDLSGIDWLIAGGESGPGARPMEEAWVQSLLTQCREYGTAFFFKQWGGVNKKPFGRELNGQVYDEMPQPRALAA